MNKKKTVIGILCGVLLLAGCDGARAAGIVPEGCIEMPGATAGDMGYATQVKHVKTGIELVLIPTGSFKLKNGEVGPVTDVTIAKPFYMGKYEVTNRQYKQFLAANKGYDGAKDCDPAYDLHVRHLRGKSIMPTGDDCPVVWVSWKNAKAFCDWAGGLDLPSDAQWEYACRAGTTTAYSFGNSDSEIGDYAWFDKNAKNDAEQYVRQKKPNAFGLYDMHGNVYEWCSDWYDRYYYPKSPAADPQGASAGIGRVHRGGDWFSDPSSCRSANRDGSGPNLRLDHVGFRIVSLDF